LDSASRIINSAGAVFHRLAGVHKFCLAENGAAALFRGFFELYQGRIADGRDHIVVKLHFFLQKP
jgi:TM2 domain-containing membrane protein YozV